MSPEEELPGHYMVNNKIYGSTGVLMLKRTKMWTHITDHNPPIMSLKSIKKEYHPERNQFVLRRTELVCWWQRGPLKKQNKKKTTPSNNTKEEQPAPYPKYFQHHLLGAKHFWCLCHNMICNASPLFLYTCTGLPSCWCTQTHSCTLLLVNCSHISAFV